MVEASQPVWPEQLTLRDTKIYADEGQRIFTTATGYGYEKQNYIRADIAERQIAELRAERDRLLEKGFDLISERESAKAEAENARLRALPLKDGVERVLEPFAKAILPDAETLSGWKFGTKPKHEHYVAARSLLSRLRAGEKEGWRTMDSAPKDGTEILVCYDAKSDPYVEDEKTGRLTPYGAHSEGGDFLDGTGITVAVWVDGWHESEDEYGSGYWMPGWWFAWFNGDTDLVVAPAGWLPLDRLPTAPKQGAK